MWLGHIIEYLMCIGGELEHPMPSPSPASKKQSTVECSARRRWGIYRQLIGPDSWLEPGLKAILLSRFLPRTGTSGCGPGAMPIGRGSAKNRDKWAKTNRDQCPQGTGRPPGLMNRDECIHWSRFVAEPGLMG